MVRSYVLKEVKSCLNLTINWFSQIWLSFSMGTDKDIIQGSELVVSKDNHDSTNVLTYSDYQKTLE